MRRRAAGEDGWDGEILRLLFFMRGNPARKFQPTEEPVYICYPDPAVLAQIGLAVVRAYVPSLTAKEAMGMLRTLQR